jgi:rod shape-determining protein MreC
MRGESRTRLHTVTIILLVVGSLALSLAGHPFLQRVFAPLSTAFIPLQQLILRVTRRVSLLPDLFRKRQALQEDVRNLRERVIQLEDQCALLRDTLAQTRRELEAVSEVPQRDLTGGGRPLLGGILSLEADVAGFGTTAWQQVCGIDLGGHAGAAVGRPVVWGAALVGVVQAVGPLGATVRLTTDPDSRVWCYDERSGVESIAVGASSEELRLLYIQWPVDILSGDVFLTTGKGGRFPPGRVVGVVTEVSRAGDGLSGEVRLRPRVLIRELRSVFVLPWASSGPPTSAASK